ncbi:hypothetical protein [Methyloversatilis sp.]|uniref:hypothetical protein n=1 Tax=Methyloversatilis sp. TaxID=2569862 RepID=UPI0027369C1C|nr:hypothetical protein [Methyloversatilis sp.]MDP2868897.1 hypothetical protein [Methyloversatilis sp.]MDP3289916.1 hypothetical protein [Methyloversatilis sp.]MDP3454469.1 hypothetical protein [Methyloversatilis sp.]MDP3577619.1 hypothetical protein [Methyloversatilis sp.]
MTMTRLLLSAMLGALLGSPSVADDTSLTGRWTGDYKTDEGIDREAEFVVTESGATWTGKPKGSAGRQNPCFNRAFAVLIEGDSDGALSLWVKASQALPLCKDLRLQLTRVSPTRLEGRFKSGAPVWLERR